MFLRVYDMNNFASGEGKNGDPARGREATRLLQKVRGIKWFAGGNIKKDKMR